MNVVYSYTYVLLKDTFSWYVVVVMLVSKISMASMLKSFGQKMVLPNVILNLIRLTWYADSAQSQRLHSSVWCVGMDVNEY